MDIIFLNFLFIFFSIPLITIGASLTALYTVSMKIVRGEPVYIWRDFLGAFRSNFYQSSIIWFMLCMGGIILFADLYFLNNLIGITKIFFFCFTFILSFLYLTIAIFVFPYMARFKDSIQKTLLNSLLIAFFHFPYLLLVIVFTVILFLFVVSSFAGFLTGIYVATFGGFSLFTLLASFLFIKLFTKYEVNKAETVDC